jgi:hypothetical protein
MVATKKTVTKKPTITRKIVPVKKPVVLRTYSSDEDSDIDSSNNTEDSFDDRAVESASDEEDYIIPTVKAKPQTQLIDLNFMDSDELNEMLEKNIDLDNVTASVKTNSNGAKTKTKTPVRKIKKTKEAKEGTEDLNIIKSTIDPTITLEKIRTILLTEINSFSELLELFESLGKTVIKRHISDQEYVSILIRLFITVSSNTRNGYSWNNEFTTIYPEAAMYLISDSTGLNRYFYKLVSYLVSIFGISPNLLKVLDSIREPSKNSYCSGYWCYNNYNVSLTTYSYNTNFHLKVFDFSSVISYPKQHKNIMLTPVHLIVYLTAHGFLNHKIISSMIFRLTTCLNYEQMDEVLFPKVQLSNDTFSNMGKVVALGPRFNNYVLAHFDKLNYVEPILMHIGKDYFHRRNFFLNLAPQILNNYQKKMTNYSPESYLFLVALSMQHESFNISTCSYRHLIFNCAKYLCTLNIEDFTGVTNTKSASLMILESDMNSILSMMTYYINDPINAKSTLKDYKNILHMLVYYEIYISAYRNSSNNFIIEEAIIDAVKVSSEARKTIIKKYGKNVPKDDDEEDEQEAFYEEEVAEAEHATDKKKLIDFTPTETAILLVMDFCDIIIKRFGATQELLTLAAKSSCNIMILNLLMNHHLIPDINILNAYLQNDFITKHAHFLSHVIVQIMLDYKISPSEESYAIFIDKVKNKSMSDIKYMYELKRVFAALSNNNFPLSCDKKTFKMMAFFDMITAENLSKYDLKLDEDLYFKLYKNNCMELADKIFKEPKYVLRNMCKNCTPAVFTKYTKLNSLTPDNYCIDIASINKNTKLLSHLLKTYQMSFGYMIHSCDKYRNSYRYNTKLRNKMYFDFLNKLKVKNHLLEKCTLLTANDFNEF